MQRKQKVNGPVLSLSLTPEVDILDAPVLITFRHFEVNGFIYMLAISLFVALFVFVLHTSSPIQYGTDYEPKEKIFLRFLC